ncbi:DUF3524 domain-containing protein [Mangrovimicrobium sediminis]|uniref:tRNA-queuosine alpha-mannosyltransferase n=1 Tax=Mangrovimicrobium sediminis TaxID=2562682 RepID=A0A4Z0M5A8_9GAMM|nr:DUF3524 domain-containing protein [Haliea sp. SAOS-164]TGD74679.1 DUF3524 domain-containing protein [Haliea sp. SAOS-164]
MRVLLLSAYTAQSHARWLDALLQMFPHWDWQQLALPPRHFSWRVRGNPLYWVLEQREVLDAGYDLLVATSMVDLATLRGLVPSLAATPALYYFHENQFAYPQDRQRHDLLEAQMVSLYGALAAPRVAFNSPYNRDSFLAGVDTLLARLPDFVPRGVAQLIAEKSLVLPVPVALGEVAPLDPWPQRSGATPLRILWSARFEHDKGGELLHAVLRELEARGMHYQLAITGQQFRQSPAVFASIQRDFAHRLAHFGFIPEEPDYRAWQRGADVFLATADHEFQGLAVMEAVRLGCFPVLPDRLAYRDFYPGHCRYPVEAESLDEQARAAADIIQACTAATGPPAAPDLDAFSPDALRPGYERCLRQLAGLQDGLAPPGPV